MRRELGGTGTGCLFQFTYCGLVTNDPKYKISIQTRDLWWSVSTIKSNDYNIPDLPDIDDIFITQMLNPTKDKLIVSLYSMSSSNIKHPVPDITGRFLELTRKAAGKPAATKQNSR